MTQNKSFFEDIIEMLTKPVENDFVGWLLLILIWILFIGLAALIVYLIICAINSWFRPVYEGYGEIVAMHFEPAHYSTILMYNAATKTSMPMQVWHPNAWKLVIQIDGEADDFYLSKQKYAKHKVGEKVWVHYSTGRIWNTVDIKAAAV